MRKGASVPPGANPWKEGSSCSPHAKLVENRLAYDVLEAVYLAIPAGTRGGPALDDPRNTLQALYDYQLWVHRRLRESGLAKGLAAGEAFLPDITVELPQFWRYLARLFAPRNYRQLALQVLGNLAWYLGEDCQPVTPVHKAQAALPPTLLMTGLALLPLMLGTNLGTMPWPVILLAAIILAAFVFCIACFWGQDTTGRHSVNCAELYSYLLESYAEPGEDEQNQVKSLLRELGRDTDNDPEAIHRRQRGPWGFPGCWG